MQSKENNYAFVDSQNLNLSIRALGWKIDFGRFRVYLKEKYQIKKAFLFIGYIEGNNNLYQFLQESGYILIFKPTLRYKSGKTKGNVDAELVLHAMIEYPNYDKAVIVTGDGDFYCLVKYLAKQNKLRQVLIPDEHNYSVLLKQVNRSDRKYFSFINRLQSRLSLSSPSKKGPQ